ncbi:putative serine protease K12H4.7 [Galendromus occidentalis]|uniref:Serine protease K12H4.7 n=1 Tax=Galendromus occidentalis TaxID=34638 RepID=A0AAJ6QSD5_9ACAR|nr:putative serine protease K12H4.7 [Galendromus occidentalis]
MIRSLVLIVVLGLAASTRLHRGRPLHKHGMLGEPRSTSRHSFGEAEIRWHTQRMNHFDPADRRTWKQRYMVNDEFYREGGPVFLLLGGEGEASISWVEKNTHVMLMAKKHNALVFQLEHRFYGQSRPTSDLSTENLVYLSSEQALADAAHFRNVITNRRNLSPDAKWVVFGGSYSGSLAAWFKLKYPHLAVGAVASSAPLLAIIDFQDYVRVVRDSLGSSCSAKVKDGFQALQVKAARRSSWPDIDNEFKTCVPFDGYNSLNLQNFFQTIAGNFEGIVQYNKDQRMEGRTNISIDDLCRLMENAPTPLEGLASVNDLLLESTDSKCLDYDYAKFVREMRNVSYSSVAAEGGRQWTYQTCVEFGFFQSSDAEDQPFGDLFPVELFIQQCRDIFDDFFDQSMLDNAIFRTNTEYGGQQPKLTNVTFPNGSIDPWHALSILKNLSDSVTAHFIEGTAHCADMYPPSAEDDETLTAGRQKIEAEVAKWLQ